MRTWGKLVKGSRILADCTVANDENDTRTHRIFRCLEETCRELDLAVPVWLDTNIRDFQRHKKTRFTPDSFVGEQVCFDYLEFSVLEE